MDIKDLNKSQLILLAVLLSFVTSIATGITTVTLMQQVPESVAIPVNRIIRQTVEKIQPVEGKANTVVVKEEDLIVDAIAKNRSATFTLVREIQNPNVGNFIEETVGKGVAVSTEGIVVVDSNSFDGSNTHYLKNANGKFRVSFVSSQSTLGFTLLKITESTDGVSKPSFTVPKAGDLSKMKIGQKIIVLGNNISYSIFEGENDLNVSNVKSNSGALMLNLDGEALGVVLSGEGPVFVPIKTVMDLVNASKP